jgi:hypothetical protein
LGFLLGRNIPIQRPVKLKPAIPAKKSQHQSKMKTGEIGSLRTPPGFSLFVFLLLAGGQVYLFLVQLRLIRESLDDAEHASAAAKEAADASKSQAKTAQGTLEAMQDIAKRQLRAYVSVIGGSVGLATSIILSGARRDLPR